MNSLTRAPAGWRLIGSDAATAPTAWANGAGSTTELIPRPRCRSITGQNSPAWRLSLARLETASAFSQLPDVHRTFMPVGGSVQLNIAGKLVDVEHLQTIQFDGGEPVQLVQLSAPCRAVNLMVDRSASPTEVALIGPSKLRHGTVIAIPDPNEVGGTVEAWEVASSGTCPSRPHLIGQVIRTAEPTQPLAEHTIVLGYN